MRTSMAYFAGAGTVIAAIGLGLGGGFTIANVMSPHQEKLEQTKLEQRMSAKPIPPSAQADQPKTQAANTGTDKPPGEQGKAPVPYVAATNAAISANAPAAQSEPQPQTQAAAPAPQSSPHGRIQGCERICKTGRAADRKAASGATRADVIGIIA